MAKMPQTITNKEAAQLMFECLSNSFSGRHTVMQKDDDFYIANTKGEFILKTFSKEAIKGSSEEVKKAVEEIILENQDKGIATGFLFLRCFTDYDFRKNHGAFLKQSWDKDKTGKMDRYNVKKITTLERAVEGLYDSGCNNEGYKSRVAYFNPKKGKIETVRFRENSSLHRISNTIGYVCDWKCIDHSYMQDEQIDHKKCKTEKQCTLYARGRDKREVIITELDLPLRMEAYRKGDLLLAEIR